MHPSVPSTPHSRWRVTICTRVDAVTYHEQNFVFTGEMLLEVYAKADRAKAGNQRIVGIVRLQH